MLKRFVDYLASCPRAFDVFRYVLEGGYVAHHALIREELLHGTDRVLDFGCGTGIFAKFFPPGVYVGVDINPDYVAAARRKNPAHCFAVMDANHMACAPGSVSAAFISGVLHHLSPELCGRALTAIRSALKPGGRLVVWEDIPARSRLNLVGRAVHVLDGGAFIRAPDEYRHLLEKHFEVLSSRPMRSGFMDYAVFVCASRS